MIYYIFNIFLFIYKYNTILDDVVLKCSRGLRHAAAPAGRALAVLLRGLCDQRLEELGAREAQPTEGEAFGSRAAERRVMKRST